MSYILDALKKSEQERGRGSAPSVQTLHAAGFNHTAGKTHRWPYVLLAAIAINLAALLYFIAAGNRDEQPALAPLTNAQAHQADRAVAAAPDTRLAAVSVSPEPVPATAPADEPAHAVVYKPVSMPATTRAFASAAAPVTDTQPPVAAAAPLTFVQRDELPTSIQQQIPVMQFSAHVYSSNPLHRSIVINGRFMEEGDQLAADLTLEEITPKGAVFDYQGQRFHQNVVSAWN